MRNSRVLWILRNLLHKHARLQRHFIELPPYVPPRWCNGYNHSLLHILPDLARTLPYVCMLALPNLPFVIRWRRKSWKVKFQSDSVNERVHISGAILIRHFLPSGRKARRVSECCDHTIHHISFAYSHKSKDEVYWDKESNFGWSHKAKLVLVPAAWWKVYVDT